MHFLFFMLMFVGHGLSFSFYCLCNRFFILRWKKGEKIRREGEKKDDHFGRIVEEGRLDW